MMRVPVRSSNIKSIGYDEETKVLEVEFHDGSVYQYYSVPASVHQGLMAAASHGNYFHNHIRDEYRCRQVE